MLCLAVAAILAGVTVAVATASGYGHHAGHRAGHAKHKGKGKGKGASRTAQRSPGGLLATAVSYLGQSKAQLRSDLQSGKTLAQVAEGTSGKSVAGLIDALVSAKVAGFAATGKNALGQSRLAAIRNHVTTKVEGGGELAVAASYLGLTPAQLHSDLHSGETLAQLAAATPGKSSASLIAALVKAKTSQLAAGVASGAISSEREKRLLAAVPRRARRRVSRSAAKPARDSAAKHATGAHRKGPGNGTSGGA